MAMYAQYNILLVEDDDNDETLILRAFKKMKLTNQIIVKRDGEEALRYFFNAQDKLILDKTSFPQLILLDLQLPRVSGLDVLQQLRAHDATQHIPIIIFTSSNDEHDITTAYAYGANSFVQKPVDMQHFITAIHDLGMYWVLHNTPPSPYGFDHA